MAKANSITPCFALSVVSYDSGSGEIRALRGALTLNSVGYLSLRVDGKSYAAHRLAWVAHHGREIVGLIDHINGSRTDNRADNLREVTRTANNQNQRRAHRSNKSSGLLGVSWHKRDKRWIAHISVGNRQKHLGSFDSAEKAHQAYIAAKRNEHQGCTI